MIDKVINKLDPYYDALKKHSIYHKLNTEKNVISFMEIHIYSVWDFMNLLKYLQKSLTCVTTPWAPYSNPRVTRLINEIVLEEESDVIDDQTTSHFHYYVTALTELTSEINHPFLFLNDLHKHDTYSNLITQSYIPLPAKKFMKHTYDTTQKSLLHVASAFTFGRENLVPSLFEPIVKVLSENNNKKFAKFISYLERHIELDGDVHSKLAFEMVTHLAKSPSDWDIIIEAATFSLEARINFWTDIENSLSY